MPLVRDSSQRIPALDGVRAVAMLAVVMCHLVWPNPTLHFDLIDRVMVNGWIGVDLFFVLSGFLITGVLLDARDGPGYFKNFYARRALRIFPIYYLFCVGVFIMIPFGSWLFVQSLTQAGVRTIAHQSWYWTYTVNVLQTLHPHDEWFHTGHLWSLSVEEQFYLVWPAIIWFTPRRRIGGVCLAIMIVAPALRVWTVLTQAEPLGAYVLTPMRADALAAGALVAVLARSDTGTAVLRRVYPWAGLASLAIVAPLLAVYGADVQHPAISTAGYSLNALVFAALIAWVVDGGGPRRFLEHRVVRRIGQVSYGGYLYHLPVIGIASPLRDRLHAFGAASVFHMAVAHVAWVSFVMITTLIVATVSYRWIETPFLALKVRFAGSDAHRPPPALTPTATAAVG
jgi:peptidoglycan/LPS O-acetylase OafA/YrhL